MSERCERNVRIVSGQVADVVQQRWRVVRPGGVRAEGARKGGDDCGQHNGPHFRYAHFLLNSREIRRGRTDEND